MANVEIEALHTLTWIRQGSRAIVEDGPGLRKLVEKGRVKVVRENVAVPVPPRLAAPPAERLPTAEELARGDG